MHSHSPFSPSFSSEKKSPGPLMQKAVYAAILISFVMIGLKAYGWVKTDSLSLFSALIDSIIDMGASLVNLYAIHRALKPASQEYRFGQSKAESLAALGQSFFIGASAFFLIHQAIVRFLHPEPLEETTLGLYIMAFASLCTLGLVWFQRWVIRKTNSLAIKADELHYKGDLLMNMGVFLTLWLSDWLKDFWLDPAFALCIAFYILYTSLTIGRSAIEILMDKELPQEVRTQILRMVFSYPEVKGIHDLRTRSGGTKHFVQLHLELEGHLTLFEAHQIADKVEKQISQALPQTEVIIHQDLYIPESSSENPLYKSIKPEDILESDR